MQPYSQNIIFIDTEFTGLAPDKSELISIALLKPTGEELYLELEYSGEPSDWVKQNVLPYLTGPKVSREETARRIREFVGPDKPYLMAFVNDFDVMHFYRLFGTENQPGYWLPVDFASILWGAGINPEKYSKNGQELARELGVDVAKYRSHNALDDVRLLKAVYDAFYKQQSGQ